jgi:mRNA interferase MazF
VVSDYTPERGHVIWLDFDPQSGREQAGRRPALVLSPGAYNGLVGLALCCPVTSRVKGYPFEVGLPDSLGVAGVVLADQVKSLDWRRRNATFAAAVPDTTIEDVRHKVLALLQ